jgi:phosphatidate cytidylyltransferase
MAVQPSKGPALLKRLVSALVLIPVALAAIWFSGPEYPWLGLEYSWLWRAPLILLVAIVGCVLAWEWARLCNRGHLSFAGALLIVLVLLAMALAAFMRDINGIWALVSSAALVAALARLEHDARPYWLGFGALYVGLPCLAILWLRVQPHGGLATLLWLFALVWATDTGAYAAGRLIGGPKLAPTISPNKTWAGLIGGAVAAAAIGFAVFSLLPEGNSLWLVPVSAALALVEQGGDLFESAAKRQAGVKDSGNLIPGHGGALDRLDGLLAVSVAVAALCVILGRPLVAGL